MQYQVSDKCSLYHEKTGALDPGSILSDAQVFELKKLGSFDSLLSDGTILEVKIKEQSEPAKEELIEPTKESVEQAKEEEKTEKSKKGGITKSKDSDSEIPSRELV